MKSFLNILLIIKKSVIGFILHRIVDVVLILLLVIPGILFNVYDMEVPGIYIFFAFIMSIRYIIGFAMMVDKNNQTEKSYHSYDYNNESFKNGNVKDKDYYNPYNNKDVYRYSSQYKEKEKNGGLTDKEVIKRKKDIRKKLFAET